MFGVRSLYSLDLPYIYFAMATGNRDYVMGNCDGPPKRIRSSSFFNLFLRMILFIVFEKNNVEHNADFNAYPW